MRIANRTALLSTIVCVFAACTPAAPNSPSSSAPVATAGAAAAPPSTGWVEGPSPGAPAGCTPQPGADPFATQHPCDNSGLSTPLDPGKWYRITTVINGVVTNCLDADQGSIHDNAIELHHRDCNRSTNQAWSPYVEKLACSGCYVLKNNQAAALLGDARSCLQTVASDFRWVCDNRPVTFFGFSGAGEIKYEAANFCLDWENEHPECDGKIKLKECNGSQNQKWKIEPFDAPFTGPPNACVKQSVDRPPQRRP